MATASLAVLKNPKGTRRNNTSLQLKGNIMVGTRTVKRSVKHPATGAEIERKAIVSHPVVFSDGEQKYAASVEELLNLVGGEEKLAEVVQQAIDAKVQYLARLELGKAETNQVQLNKAIRNLKAVFGDIGEDVLRAQVMAMPGAAEKFSVDNIPTEVSLTLNIADIFKAEPESEEAAA